ncbi:MAG: hypothetical protein ACFCBU_05185 [Cyanophyceae cyanobacterium]
MVCRWRPAACHGCRLMPSMVYLGSLARPFAGRLVFPAIVVCSINWRSSSDRPGITEILLTKLVCNGCSQMLFAVGAAMGIAPLATATMDN